MIHHWTFRRIQADGKFTHHDFTGRRDLAEGRAKRLTGGAATVRAWCLCDNDLCRGDSFRVVPDGTVQVVTDDDKAAELEEWRLLQGLAVKP